MGKAEPGRTLAAFLFGDEVAMVRIDMLKKVFRPEFLNRIDEVIVFHKLAKTEVREIVELLLKRVSRKDQGGPPEAMRQRWLDMQVPQEEAPPAPLKEAPRPASC